MKILDYREGRYKSTLTEGGEVHVVRRTEVCRSELETTKVQLAQGTWIAVEMEEFGEVLVERFRRIKKEA